MPQILALSKSDLLTQQELERIRSWVEDGTIIDELGTIDEYSYELVNTIIENLDNLPIPVSSTTGDGFDELYAELQRIFAGGEDYLTEEPNPKL